MTDLPDQHYLDPDGNPITVEEWGHRFENYDNRVLLKDDLPRDKMLVTLWLGFVDPMIDTARLFGTALLENHVVNELETYDSKAEAAAGHARHLAALRENP